MTDSCQQSFCSAIGEMKYLVGLFIFVLFVGAVVYSLRDVPLVGDVLVQIACRVV